MKFETFERIHDLMVKLHEKIHTLYQLKIDLIEAFEEHEFITDLLWKEILTEEGYDWLTWFYYEKNSVSGKLRKDMNAYDQNNNEICKDLKGLWEYLIENNYFKNGISDNKDK